MRFLSGAFPFGVLTGAFFEAAFFGAVFFEDAFFTVVASSGGFLVLVRFLGEDFALERFVGVVFFLDADRFEADFFADTLVLEAERVVFFFVLLFEEDFFCADFFVDFFFAAPLRGLAPFLRYPFVEAFLALRFVVVEDRF